MLQHDDGESEANARLIAAAPELLEALEDVISAWEQEMAETPNSLKGHEKARFLHRVNCNVRARAKQAIAKAKGET